MISEIEQETHDFDWFFTDGENIGFVASGGGKLPESVAFSKDNIDLLSEYFRNLRPNSSADINPDLENILADGNPDDRYLSDFII